MSKSLLTPFFFLFFITPIFLYAQGDVNEGDANQRADKKESEEVKYPQFQLKGLLQARYLESFGDNVDVLGTHHSTGDPVQSSFDIKRMRVGLNTKLSETTEIVILVNLADFKSDPKGKVLENA